MMVAPGSLRNRVAGIYAVLLAANGAPPSPRLGATQPP